MLIMEVRDPRTARSVRVGTIFFDYSWCWCGPSLLVHNWLLNLKNLKPKTGYFKIHFLHPEGSTKFCSSAWIPDGGFLEQWKFKDSVMVNGYKKLKNYRPPIYGCCVCVVELEMKWHFKCLILFFIASFVFALVAMTLGIYCKHY